MTSARTLDAPAVLDLDLSGVSLIEASAGTGKTYTITNLYLRHILEGYRPADILVVSFTNAATDELHHRIHARLYEAWHVLNSDEPPQDEFLALLQEQHLGLESAAQGQALRRIQYALRSMDEAMISTIHGFCHKALKDHALLGNQQFDTELIANDDDFWEGALRDWWRRNTYQLSALEWSFFCQAVPSFGSLQGWHRQLRNHPHDQFLPRVEIPLAELLQTCSQGPVGEADPIMLSHLKTRALLEARRFARQQVVRRKTDEARLAFQDQLDMLLAALQSPAGEQLAARLRERYPVAMIDEFQDTDNIQFSIFEILYFEQQKACLTLIGDPKQAIYAFRGGDVFTYIKARSNPLMAIYALQTNWRSQAGLVNAVNHFFKQRKAPFIYDEAIGFVEAQASAGNDSATLSINQQASKALTLWQLPLRDNNKTLTVTETRQRLNKALVAEISRLLDPANQVQIDGRSLQSRDIAVLVRERIEGEELRTCLAAAGIGSVTIGRDNVFASTEARGLFDLLDGIAHPFDNRYLRRACTSNLLGMDYTVMAKVIDDDSEWQRWTDQVQDFHRLWIRSGFITMYQALLEKLALGDSLARQADAERKLTNLSQLAELLQQESRTRPAIDALLNWFQQQMCANAGEDAELRLESDQSLVKIVTVHKSKGLEYPVVFLPFLWRCKLAGGSSAPVRYHDHDYQAFIDLGSEDYNKHAIIAEKERLAEDLRLLYVALTRARSKVYLAWGDAGDGRSKGRPKHTALAYLLHSKQTAEDLETELPEGFDQPASMLEQLADFAGECADIELTAMPDDYMATNPPAAPAVTRHSATEFTRVLGPAWRINSFSSLTRDVHQISQPGERESQGDSILDFPAGSHIGLLLHELLEYLDFQGDISLQSRRLIQELAPSYGITRAEQWQTLGHWLEQMMTTELDQNGLRLNRLGNHQRLNEIQFDLAVDYLDIDAVNQLLQSDTEQPLQPITATSFRGLLTGVIDLVFEYQGKFYLADYKSNHLGNRLSDYQPGNLSRAMLDRRYDLQALVYSIALHRYLQGRIPDYRFEQHFGGYYYLFLRALRPSSGNLLGVFFERPSASKIEALEQLLRFTACEVGSL